VSVSHYDATESSSRIVALFEKCEEAVFVLDTGSMQIMSCNSAAESVFGQAADEMIGQTIAVLHLDAREFERASRELADQLAGKKVFESYGFLSRRNGDQFPCHQRAFTLAMGGHNRTALYLVEDESPACGAGRNMDSTVSPESGPETREKSDAVWPLLRSEIGADFVWHYAEAWVPNMEGRLALRATWARNTSNGINRIAAESESMTFELGEDLPGRAWKHGRQELLDDVANVSSPDAFRRGAISADAGMRTWFAVPVHFRGLLVGVLTFASPGLGNEDEQAPLEKTRRACHRLAPLLHETWGRELECAHAERFRRLFHAHPLPMWVCDMHTLRIRDINEPAGSLSGYAWSEIQGKAYPELLDARSWDELSRRLTVVDSTPGPVDTVFLITREGAHVPLRLQAFTTPWERADRVALLGAPVRGVEKVFGAYHPGPDEVMQRLNTLSRRESDVLKRLVYGETNKEIGRALGISSRTVEVYRAAMLSKMGVRSTPHLLSILTFDTPGRR